MILEYTRLRDITSDVDDARVYGGIHFRFDQEGGAEQGRQVGAYVYRHSLRPARDCSATTRRARKRIARQAIDADRCQKQ